MADDIIKRVNYFDRQFLRAADFKDEQRYHLHRHRLHNKLLHTPGLADLPGLDVTGRTEDSKVSVHPGEAVDKDGREIILLERRDVQLPEMRGTYALVIRCLEIFTDDSNDPGVEGKTRITETPDFYFEKLEGDVSNRPDLTLAVIEVNEQGQLANKPNTKVRKRAGTVVGSSTKFDDVTAKSLILKDIDDHTTVSITSDGAIVSPMWNLNQLFNVRTIEEFEPNRLIAEAIFATNGGTLVIFVTASISLSAGSPAPDGTPIGINVLLDDVKHPGPTSIGESPTVMGCARSGNLEPMVTATLVIRGIKKDGRHKLTLKTADNTKLKKNAVYSVEVLELPF